MKDREKIFRAVDQTDPEECQSQLRELGDTIREVMEDLLEKLENMPEGLQAGPTGELLQQRVDACETLADALDAAADEVEAAHDEFQQRFGDIDPSEDLTEFGEIPLDKQAEESVFFTLNGEVVEASEAGAIRTLPAEQVARLYEEARSQMFRSIEDAVAGVDFTYE